MKYFFALASATLILAGCSSKPLETTLDKGFTPGSQALKVAVLPVDTTDNGQAEVAQMFREELYANLQESSYELQALSETDALLAKNKWADGKAATAQLEKDPKALGKLLGVDALLGVRVAKWSLTYLAVHSDVELVVDAWLVDARTGRQWMFASKGVKRTSGITQVPTGFIAAGTSPVMGLTKESQDFVVHQLAREIAAVLGGQE